MIGNYNFVAKIDKDKDVRIILDHWDFMAMG
jgi:hypothetical protein